MGTKGNQLKAENRVMTLRFEDPQVMRTLLGDMDKNLKLVEHELEISATHNGQTLEISGSDAEVELAIDLFTQLKTLAERGEHIWETDIQRALKMLSGNRKLR